VGVEPELRGSGWANVFGRRFSIGALAGVGLGDDLRPAQASPSFFFRETPESNRPIVGIMLELNLYRNLFVEADGIYRALHATDSSSGGSVRFAVLTWEFPVLAKYKFRASHRVRPLAELGPSFRLDGNFNGPTPSHSWQGRPHGFADPRGPDLARHPYRCRGDKTARCAGDADR
jgi:hypothetical protein